MLKKLVRKISPPPSARKLAREIVWDKSTSGGRNFLCMTRAVFSQDLEALRAFGRFRYSVIKASRFEQGMAAFYPPELRRQTFFHGVFKKLPASERQKGVHFARDFLVEARKLHAFDGVIAGNSDYWQDEPLKAACKELSVPFIVLSRENYIQDYERDFLINRIREADFRYEGALMCVASERCREVLLETRAYESAQMAVTGWPRMDRYKTPVDGQGAAKKNVTLMSYQDPLYLAPGNFMETLDSFVALSRKYSKKYDFVIKVKKISHAKKLVAARPSLLLAPVRIEWKALSSDVVRNSRIVIGYNTTGVLEAILSCADIIVPWWGDAVQPESNLLISAHSASDREVFNFPESKEDFETIMEGFLAQDHCLIPEEVRRKNLEKYIFMPQHGACRAFEDAVDLFLCARDASGPAVETTVFPA